MKYAILYLGDAQWVPYSDRTTWKRALRGLADAGVSHMKFERKPRGNRMLWQPLETYYGEPASR